MSVAFPSAGVRLVRFLLPKFSPTSTSAFLLHRRTFLTEAHQCDESWERVLSRTQSFNDDSFEKYSITLLDKSNRGFANSAVQLDTLAHKLQDVEDLASLEIFEPLLRGVRQSPAAGDLHWGTSHAIVRGYLDMNLSIRLTDRLLPAKLEYGVFLDGYSALFLLNDLVLKKDWTRCSKVAEDLMLQECFYSPLLRRMCMLSVLRHFLAGGVDQRQEAWEEADEEEQQRLSVQDEVLQYYHYRPNGYHDGHFDLKTPTEIVGKTASMLGQEEGGELGAAFSLLGAALSGEEAAGKMIADLEAFDRQVAASVVEAVAARFEGNEDMLSKLHALKTSTLDCEAELTKLIQADVSAGVDEFRGSYDALMRAWSEERLTVAEKEHWIDQEKEMRRLATEQLKSLEKQEEVLTYFENELKVELLSNLAVQKKKEDEVPLNPFERYVRTLHPDLVDHKKNMDKTWYPVPCRRTARGNAGADEIYYWADYYNRPWWSF